MKFRRTAKSILISLLLIFLSLCAVVCLNLTSYTKDSLQTIVDKILPKQKIGLDISVSSMDGTIMKAIRLSDISVSFKGQDIATINEASVSLNAWQLVRLALFKNVSNVNVSVNGVNISLDDTTINNFSSLSGNEEKTNEKKSSKEGLFSKFGFSVSIRDLYVSAFFNGINVNLSQGSVQLGMKKGLVLSYGAFNAPSLKAVGIGESELSVNDIRLSMDEDLVAYGSIESITYADLASITSVSALAQITDSGLSTALYLDRASAQYKNDSFDLDALLNAATIKLEYSFGQSGFAFEISPTLISASEKNQDMKLKLEDTLIQGHFLDKDNVSCYMSLGKSVFDKGTENIHISDIQADLAFNLSSLSSMGQVTIEDITAYLDESTIFENLYLRNGIIDYSVSTQGLGGRIQANIGGKSDNSLLGTFSANLDISGQSYDFTCLDYASIGIKDLVLPSIKDSAELQINSSQKAVDIRIAASNELSGSLSLDLENSLLDVALFLSSFKPYDYALLYDNIKMLQSFICQSTSLDGGTFLSFDLSQNLIDAIDSLVHFKAPENFATKTVFDFIDNGRISLNTAVSDVRIGAAKYAGAMTIDAFANEKEITIDTFAVSTKDLRLSYSGRVDLTDLLPDGNLSLQNSYDGSELASIYFSYLKGEKIYYFQFRTPLEETLDLSGSFNWENLDRIVASAKLNTIYVRDEGITFDATIQTNPLSVCLKGDGLDLDVSLMDSKINILGNFDELLINASEDLQIVSSLVLDGYFDTATSGFDLLFDDFTVNIAKNIGLKLDLHLSDKSLEISQFEFGSQENRSIYDGKLSLGFDSISNILKGNTSSITGYVDLVGSNGNDLLASASDDQYYLDLKIIGLGENDLDARLSVLGKRGEAFYATSQLDWNNTSSLVLNAQYQDGVLSFYDTSGSLGSLKLDNIRFNMDISRMVLEASLDFLNQRTFAGINVKEQKGTLALSAKVEGLTTNLFQLFAGLDYEILFNLDLTDCTLADGYTVSDLNSSIVFKNGRFTIDGNLIDGILDTREGLVDLHLDSSFLFGFDITGRIGKNLDVFVSNIYFPLPLMNQLIDLPFLTFEDGNLVGDILIKGTTSNPSFYGMAYCQSLGLSLFYLPEQEIHLKNASISLQDHTIYMSKTSFSGFSNLDGRYFSGQASLEILFQGLGVQVLSVDSDIDSSTPVDFWVPLRFGNTDFEVRGDAYGNVNLSLQGGRALLTTNIDINNTLVDFRLPEMPYWFNNPSGKGSLDLDIGFTTGKNVEFYYPEKDNSFLNFTLSENEQARLQVIDGKISTDGGLALKTGQVYYIHNDFIIKEGRVDLSEKKYNAKTQGLPFILNLSAQMTDYDQNGNKVVIDLILKDSTFDNIQPMFTSTPSMSQNEILSLLGQTVITSGLLGSQLSVASLASFAASTADALTRVGVLESNNSYSLAATIRNTLGLDIFSARSSIVSNVIVNALPGDLSTRDVSMISRYLDGTSLFAGKYLNEWLFLRLTLKLKADYSANLSNDKGHFLAKDLILDTELSIDWDNLMGTFTIFSKPQELSVFDILDTIGFSVTKQVQF